MSPVQFCETAKRIFGKSGWKGQVADALQINRSTVWRYANGTSAIPEQVSLAMEALLKRERA
jgi:transcriptional regulator with XRE-family HTH domain